MSRSAAIIVAAGRGHRMESDIPKQYLTLGGEPILRLTARALLNHPDISTVTAVINFDDLALYEAAVEGLELEPPVEGGARRQDSVRNGLESLSSHPPDKVLIHDGARPFLNALSIDHVLEALDEMPGAIAAMPVNDTLKRGQEGCITKTVDRTSLWRAQTPQGFRYAEILAAHRAAADGLELTDDAAVAEQAGLPVALVMGNEDNFKITSAGDLARGERMMMEMTGNREIRVGTGFDVHRFEAGDGVTLCGVKIPHNAKLAGHSDADVALHALTDAILGALGAGDIGHHFPPSEAKWKGASSDIFLNHAGKLVSEGGGQIIGLDLTVICEAPKLGPHRAAMIARTAEILQIDPARVSVKATTTEGLGFTGRGEGIAAQATATLTLPALGPASGK
ncbi:MAG: bifunctional 2-C-methyl-D-erythritol 4-phosphate cytidylyltransferase/2-C-methyl-D-erythritol 2,4-cyclodiphosphate synthase [Rhodospirillaceae bacterium]|jgi:2-C-methyl-D-erythritol 4-phosphate cytidylyltransferase / 2-C-methyl-D-erythritol 2,4-cyclodiphosphate synthase|nr:bifunctional 2-C-methyl-D-erythritol 4-phosphate cytidylyltransferase/2-C-methyl-D-erythritol 2,4-cyclodiphosphate synthase [Rhodospirillaceae bacterium]MBT5373645.1 bifunctional 2-C-methyl-D-erythritol 4-phosphate cytidylyltransferase/2-C-methyl-D-erythritol 2,4-cyclodiphosphate synthase [Rhodospirillaceae bacterium]MBT5752655.1 bifunctional 2-C-methyl-D-erythritol 4-phosphate cytidylyltransferase/2-C-methyl-D-erythritol 2,4-cyclodiphosphate synthase [Rhodospirillaceae bacterium]